MAKPSPLLTRLLKDRNSGYYFNAIRMQRIKAEEETVAKHVWDNKVHPSSLHFDMCLEDFFENIDKKEAWKIDNIYKAAAGTAKHKELQDEALKCEGLLWEKPKLTPELMEKMEKTWPEIPLRLTQVVDPDNGDVIPFDMSMRLDHVLNIKGRPVPIDIKTTSVGADKQAIDRIFKDLNALKDDEAKEKAKGEAYSKALLKSWNDKMDKYEQYFQGNFEAIPKGMQTIGIRKYFTQMCCYTYTLNELQAYDVPVERMGLCYLNMIMPPGDQGSEREMYRPFGDDLKLMTGRFLTQVAYHWVAKLGEIKRPCSNPMCEKHGSNQSPTT